MSGYFLLDKKIYLKNKKIFGKGFKILSDILINTKGKLKVEDLYINFKRRYESKSKMNYKILLILIQFYIISLFKNYFSSKSFFAISSIALSLSLIQSLYFLEILFLIYFFASKRL